MTNNFFDIECFAVKAVEAAAIAAHEFVGLGDEIGIDEKAIAAMSEILAAMPVRARILIGEGEEGDVETLFQSQEIGHGKEVIYDIALDALEGITLAAKGMHNALSVIAIAKKGELFAAPEVYMEKLAIGAGYPNNIISLDNNIAQNIENIAKFKGTTNDQIGVCVLDRPRHASLIDEIRQAGAKVFLISDGDVAGCLFTTDKDSQIDIYMGVGGAPEGVLAAAALSCVGGQFEGRFLAKSDDDKRALRRMGIENFKAKYAISDLVKGDVVFAACGVTNGRMVRGISRHNGEISSETLVLDSALKTLKLVRCQRFSPNIFEEMT